MRSKNGFTLIELLVVIAIIALLLAILIPSLQTAKEMAQGAVCLAHLRGLSMSYYLFSQDNDDKLVMSHQGPDRWVDVPHAINPVTGARDYTSNDPHNSTMVEKENGIRNGLLFPYTEAPKVYHCVGDKRYKVNVGTRGKGPYRSYALPAGANSPDGTNGWNWDTGINIGSHHFNTLRKYSDFVSPSDKYIFVEENYTHQGGTDPSLPPDAGYNKGVWSFWKYGYTSWWDPLAPWHNDRTNLGYADGHAEKLVWKDERTVKFAHDRWSVPYNQPNNPDQEYMSRAYPCRR